MQHGEETKFHAQTLRIARNGEQGLGSGSLSTITICDKETVPVCTWNAVPIAANTVYDPMTPIFPPNTVCELWPSGITFTAGTAGAIVFEARRTYVGN